MIEVGHAVGYLASPRSWRAALAARLLTVPVVLLLALVGIYVPYAYLFVVPLICTYLGVCVLWYGWLLGADAIMLLSGTTRLRSWSYLSVLLFAPGHLTSAATDRDAHAATHDLPCMFNNLSAAQKVIARMPFAFGVFGLASFLFCGAWLVA